MFLAPLLAALLSMVNSISTVVSDNKTSRRVQVFLKTSCTFGIIFSVNLHSSQIISQLALPPTVCVSSELPAPFTVIPRFNVKDHGFIAVLTFQSKIRIVFYTQEETEFIFNSKGIKK